METNFNNEGYALAKEMYKINEDKIIDATKEVCEKLGKPLTPGEVTFIKYGYILGAFNVINGANKQGTKIEFDESI